MADAAVRRAVAIVASLNVAYFGVEFAVALAIASVSLLADSIDFLEDAAVNFLVFVALAWSARRRAQAGMFLAGVLLIPATAFLWALWDKFRDPLPPEAISLGVTAMGALLVNLTCSFILARHRHGRGSLTKAAFLSARNDTVANAGIIAASLITAAWPSIWPDVIVGSAIALINAGAAKEVWEAARSEHAQARTEK